MVLGGLHVAKRKDSHRHSTGKKHEFSNLTYSFWDQVRLCVNPEEQAIAPGKFRGRRLHSPSLTPDP